jgi:hypothetical protein
MLTLRVNTPAGSWLSDEDHAIYVQLFEEAESSPDGVEGLVLSMMNLAWYALIYLSVNANDERSAAEWLRGIAEDLASIEDEQS